MANTVYMRCDRLCRTTLVPVQKHMNSSLDFALGVFARRPFEKGLARRMDYKRHFALLTEALAQNYKGSVNGEPPSRRDMLRLHMALRFAKRFKQTW
jgi:hypothetical protein